MRTAPVLAATLAAVALAHAEQDYIKLTDAEYAAWEAANSGEAPRKSSVRAISGDGATVTYTAFNGTVYTGMSEYRGKYVRVLYNSLWMTTTTEAQRIQYLDYADRVYSDLRQMIGREPDGAGLLSIAIVTTCGGGCGHIGRKGIELDPAAWLRDEALKALAASGTHNVVVHEMAHNFDVYHNHLQYWGDWGHAWTYTATYLLFYSQEGEVRFPPAQLLRSDRAANYDPYITETGQNWANCINGPGCTTGRKNQIWGGLLLRFAELHGPSAVARSMEFLKSYTANNSIPATNELKADLHIEALAYGAQLNLACYVDRWRWAASSALRARMTAQYGSSNPFCQDQDGDGFSRLDGDTDDSNPSVKPGAAEIAANGRDDNSNGFIDETVYDEPAAGDFTNNLSVTLPALIRGRLGDTSDGDKFTMTLSQPAGVLLRLRSLGAMRGWLFFYKQDNTWLDYRYVGTGGAGGLGLDLAAGTWTFEVAMNNESTPGSYALDVETVPSFASWAAVSANGNRLRLASPNPSRYAQSPDGIEVWLGRYGVIRKMAWDGSSNVEVDVDSGDAPGGEAATYPYAFRATRLGHPVTDWTDYPAQALMTYTPPPLSITNPVNGSTVTSTILSFQWTAVATANTYELRLIEANTPQQFRVTLLAGQTSAIYTVKSGNYRMEVRACGPGGCSSPAVSTFTVAGGAIPSVAPGNVSCPVTNDSNQNRLFCSWNAVPGAHFYFINIVQPGAGPGGGALTIAGRQAGTNAASFLVPNGNASAVVRACTGDGCGPWSAAAAINATFGNPSIPFLGEPFAGSAIDSGTSAPTVLFSWNRVAGDNGSNYTYRLYVQDFSRNRPALDVYTANNYYAAYFNPGTRYDALVIAIPNGGGQQRQGPASAFLVRGAVPKSPVASEPGYGGTVDRDSQGRVRVVWTPIINADGTVSPRRYQYFFSGPTQAGGVTTDNFADLALGPGSWQGVMRACTTGTTCVESSPNGWGPWNNTAGSEGGIAAFTVR